MYCVPPVPRDTLVRIVGKLPLGKGRPLKLPVISAIGAVPAVPREKGLEKG